MCGGEGIWVHGCEVCGYEDARMYVGMRVCGYEGIAESLQQCIRLQSTVPFSYGRQALNIPYKEHTEL